MAKTLYLKDGNYLVYMDPKEQFGKTIEEYMGRDALELYNEIIAKYEDEADSACHYDAEVEQVIDSYQSWLRDILSRLEGIKYELDTAKRINRKNIRERIDEITKEIEGDL